MPKLTINTKYKKGDKVWIMDYQGKKGYIPRKTTIKNVEKIDNFRPQNPIITYRITKLRKYFLQEFYFLEEEMTKTKQEMITKCINKNEKNLKESRQIILGHLEGYENGVRNSEMLLAEEKKDYEFLTFKNPPRKKEIISGQLSRKQMGY